MEQNEGQQAEDCKKERHAMEMYGNKKDEDTHVFICVFDESISAGLALERTRLVKKVIQLCDPAELGEYLKKCIPTLYCFRNSVSRYKNKD